MGSSFLSWAFLHILLPHGTPLPLLSLSFVLSARTEAGTGLPVLGVVTFFYMVIIVSLICCNLHGKVESFLPLEPGLVSTSHFDLWVAADVVMPKVF